MAGSIRLFVFTDAGQLSLVFEDYFFMWTTFEVFTDFDTIFLVFYVFGFLAWRHVGSLTRDRTLVPCFGSTEF